MNTARNAEIGSLSKCEGKDKKLASEMEDEGQNFIETLESWKQAREGNKKAAEDGVGKEGFFDIMENMDKEEKVAQDNF